MLQNFIKTLTRFLSSPLRRAKWFVCLLFIAACTSHSEYSEETIKSDLRAPAYPLLTLHPSVNIWSAADRLTDKSPSFTNGKELPLNGILRVDGTLYLFMGDEQESEQAVAPMASQGEWTARYTMDDPGSGWEQPTFDDAAWKVGKGAFASEVPAQGNSLWNRSRLWVRREVCFDPSLLESRQLYMQYSHNDGIELYINGKRLVKTDVKAKENVRTVIPDSIVETMTEGKALIAARCVNWGGKAEADFGLYARMKRAEQLSADVQATQTHYTFRCGKEMELKLTFTDPRLPGDERMWKLPVNYISYRVKALDGKRHDVSVCFEMRPDEAFDAGQSTQVYRKNGWTLVKTGKENQELWADKSKDTPAWGYFYLGAKEGLTYARGSVGKIRDCFGKCGELEDGHELPENPCTAVAQRLNPVSESPQHLIAVFDELSTTMFFGDELHPCWNRDGKHTIGEVCELAETEYRAAMARCYAFDRKVMEEGRRAGGKEYAELCALAYRQTVSSFLLAETPEGEQLCFTPVVGSVDVCYAASPLFLYAAPQVMEGILNPIFHYSENGRWKKPYPARDMGVVPFVNGWKSGNDMPVESAGSMLIMTAALAQAENDVSYAKKHWETLSKWAAYLLANGVETGEQNNADYFAKLVPNHANLSIKGILGIAAYARLAEMLGEQETADTYRKAAQEMAKEWETRANAGDHYKLAFGQPDDTWGMKYNLVWDRVLGLNLFPEEIVRKELAYYAGKAKEYGYPLDSRGAQAKVEWTVWTAAMAADTASFRSFLLPLYRYMNETTRRVPMPDRYDAGSLKNARQNGRPVVGGCFMGLLSNGRWQ